MMRIIAYLYRHKPNYMNYTVITTPIFTVSTAQGELVEKRLKYPIEVYPELLLLDLPDICLN